MKKLFTLLAFLMLGFVGFTQTCPTPTGTGVYVMLDSMYKIAPSTAQKTNVGLCYYNNSGTELLLFNSECSTIKQRSQKLILLSV